MGYDITYHPISEHEMHEWYFEPLAHLQTEQQQLVQALAQTHQMDELYVNKFIDTLQVGMSATADDYFDKTHGYYLAVVHGFFRTYYYTRGSAFSFLIQEKPAYKSYTRSWAQMLGHRLRNPAQSHIFENYCSGVYIPFEEVERLLHDYRTDSLTKAELDNYYSHGRINVFLKALVYCEEHRLGLLEATEVVEPNPMDLNQSVSYSNLLHCDTEGPLLYHEAAMEQIREIEKENNLKPGEIAANAEYKKVQSGEAEAQEKKGFWKKLFGK